VRGSGVEQTNLGEDYRLALCCSGAYRFPFCDKRFFGGKSFTAMAACARFAVSCGFVPVTILVINADS
jgi:hypothetical protein